MARAIVYALDDEVRSLLKGSTRGLAFQRGTIKIEERGIQGVPVLFCRSGVGPGQAHEGCEALIERFNPPAIVSVGYCGGLRTGLHRGDLVLPQEVCGEAGDRFVVDAKLHSELASSVEAEGVSCHVGSLLTVFHPLKTPTEKSRQGERGYAAVDMEGAAVAAVCQKGGIPFASLKVVFDPVEMELPSRGDGHLEWRAWFRLPSLIKSHLACQRNLVRVLSRWLTSSGGNLARENQAISR